MTNSTVGFVRCCADEATLVSDASCTELRAQAIGYGSPASGRTEVNVPWTEADADAGVCATSFPIYDGFGKFIPPVTAESRCLRNRDYWRGDAICLANGARLCTLPELTQLTSGTGCGFDAVGLTLTSSECTLPNGASGILVATGTGTSPQCVTKSAQSYNVRCCADEIVPERRRSKRTCQQLQWGATGFGRLTVCAGSLVKNGQCVTEAVTHADAEATCAAIGARLCTLSESHAQESAGSGCGHDSQWVWTTGACGRCGVDGAYAFMAQPESGIPGEKRCFFKSETAAFVRCCADSSTETAVVTGTSCKTCGELGWDPLVRGPLDVCAASEVATPDGGCIDPPVPITVAEEFCANLGARLCSLDELHVGVTSTTGCGKDAERVWSRSACGNGQFYTAAGTPDQAGIHPDACTPGTSTAHTRCCADDGGDRSALTCAELRALAYNYGTPKPPLPLTEGGWTLAGGGNNNRSCAASFLAYDVGGNLLPGPDDDSYMGERCQKDLTPATAALTCLANGARLCTQSEVQSLSPGTGCGFDIMPVITGSRCRLPDGSLGYKSVVPRANADGTYTTTCSAADAGAFALRCCGDEELPGLAREISQRSCRDLQWPATATGLVHACGHTPLKPDGTCPQPGTLVEARAFCQARGARLCSVQEAVIGEGAHTGCGFNDVKLWTSTPCGRCGQDSYNTVTYGSGGTPTVGCVNKGWINAFRCCADTFSLAEVEVEESCKTCSELGWAGNANSDNSPVCSDSEVGAGFHTGACVTEALPLQDAARLCHAVGARLCSLDEVKAGESSLTGCGHDGRTIWTRTACPGGYFTLRGDGAGNQRCSRPDEEMFTRCCADESRLRSDLSCSILRTLPANTGNPDRGGTTVNAWTTPSGEDRVCAASYLAYNERGRLLPGHDNIDIHGPRCQSNRTQEEAERICALNGARLCSAGEARRHGPGSGCYFDEMPVATGSLCATPGSRELDGALTVRRDKEGIWQYTCVRRTVRGLAVRCCADEDVAPPAVSAKSCQELGFEDNGLGAVRVCGDSEVVPPAAGGDQARTCLDAAVPFSRAQDTCAALGARLCSFSELLAGEGATTGCQHDGKPIWSSTHCSRCGYLARIAVTQTASSSTHDCLHISNGMAGARDDLGFVRCCADVEEVEILSDSSSCAACENLLWPYDPAGNAFCSAANVYAGSCSHAAAQVDLATAHGVCAEQGARVCDASELETRAYMASGDAGCEEQLTGKMLWSRTPCDLGEGADNVAAWTVPFNSTNSTLRACQRINTPKAAFAVCCADPVSVVKSDQTCSELQASPQNQASAQGWRGTVDEGSNVCAASELPYDLGGRVLPPAQRCIANQTLAEAQRVCATNGARLCTRYETTHHAATGCGFDALYTITPSPCANATNCGGEAVAGAGFYAIKAGTGETVCRGVDLRCADQVVRCCGDEDAPARIRSKQTCTDLGWATDASGRSDVCASSTVSADGACVTEALGYNEAMAVCTAIGARLCSYSENVAGEARGSGCGHDFRAVWTSTDCGRCHKESKLVYTQPNGAATGTTQCLAVGGQKANVRCCADQRTDAQLLSGSSCKTCSELGWPAGSGNVSTCAASEVVGDASLDLDCVPLPVTFSAAERICYDAGARLCSVAELSAGETAGSGCDFDYEYIWSRTPCNDKQGFWVHIGRSSAAESPDLERKCIDSSSSSGFVRCCADEITRKSDRPCFEHRVAAQGYANPARSEVLPGGWKQTDGAPVCAASNLAYDARGQTLPAEQRCHLNATFIEAKQLCAANFAR